MFIVPAAFTLLLGLMGRMHGKPGAKKLTPYDFLEHYKLELWLCGLGVVFVSCYVMLSLIPSLYQG